MLIHPVTTQVALTSSAVDVSSSKRVYLVNTHTAEVVITLVTASNNPGGSFTLKSGEAIICQKLAADTLSASVDSVVYATGTAFRE